MVNRFVIPLLVCLMWGATLSHTRAADDDGPSRSTVEAPAGSAKVASGRGGAYFADKDLVKRYNDLKSRLKTIKQEILEGRPSSKSALQELDEIEKQSKEIRETIDATKTFVSAFNAYKKTEEVLIPLAESKRIIMRGDSVTMRGWEGPDIKVVIEKVILAKEKPQPNEFDAMLVEHEVTIAEQLVGRTPAQRAADAQRFRESEAGKKMTSEQLASREAFVKKLFAGYSRFADFQGIEANVLSIGGLRHDQGNTQISYRINSSGGGATVSSTWKRHSTITVYVPKCNHVLVAGCMVKLDIAEIDANLTLTTSDSRDRDYEGAFVVRSINGNVTIDQAPVRTLEDVSGDVDCTVTNEFVNSGTRHSGGYRTSYTYETEATRFSNIKGNLVAHFLRTDLHLDHIGGLIDIRNEYGTTSLAVESAESIDRAMRVITESGQINLFASRECLESVPIYAYTQCGTIHTDLPRAVLDDIDISTGTPVRNWQGFITPSKEPFSMDKFERPAKAIDNEDRTAGIDLISHCGRVEILSTDQ